MSYTDIAERIVDLWRGHFNVDRPFLEKFEEWCGIEYPIAAAQPRMGSRDQGMISPQTDFIECLANARSYAAPHLLQFAEALDHERATTLRNRLNSDHEAIVVDVGCAAGILSLFVDRAGLAHYVGVDTNPWMRFLSRAVFETVLHDLALRKDAAGAVEAGGNSGLIERAQYSVATHPRLGTKVSTVRTDRPSFVVLDDIDAHDGWSKYVRRVATNADFSAPEARRLTVLLVMNHLMFQLHDVPRTVTSAIDKCRDLASLKEVAVYLVSIEPGRLYKPDRLGTQGLDRVLRERGLTVERFSVPGVSAFLTGSSKGNAAVRLVSFGD